MSLSLRQATESLPMAVSDWSEVDVGAFLDNIGLHEYSQVFIHERIRGVTLADLTMEDVYGLGVHRLGDRKYFFKALEHILAEDEAHHSNYVPLTRNSRVPPPSGRAVSTSFDVMARQRRSAEQQHIAFNSTAESLLVEEDEELLEPVQVVIKKKATKKPVTNPLDRPRNVAPVDFIEYKAIDPRDVPRNNKRRMSGPPAIEVTGEMIGRGRKADKNHSQRANTTSSAAAPVTPQHALASSVVEHATEVALSSQSPPMTTVKRRKKAVGGAGGRRRDLTISPEVTLPRRDPALPPLVDEEVNSLSSEHENYVDEANTPKRPPHQPHHSEGILRGKDKPPPKTVEFEQFVENHDEIPKSSISK
jgi:hypothetical protein